MLERVLLACKRTPFAIQLGLMKVSVDKNHLSKSPDSSNRGIAPLYFSGSGRVAKEIPKPLKFVNSTGHFGHGEIYKEC